MKEKIMGLAKAILRLIITMIIVVMIAFLPSIFEYKTSKPPFTRIESVSISFSQYPESIGKYFTKLLDGDLGSYSISGNSFYTNTKVQKERAISSSIFGYYKITLTIFVSALAVGISLGLIAAFFTLLLKEKRRKIFQLFSLFIVSVPDFLVILLLQFLIIFIYKKTGFRLFAVATGGSSEAIFLPIFTLSLFPFAYVYRTTLHSFEEILSQDYIRTAYSKGLRRSKVILHHITKNSLIQILNNLPSILVLTLSNLFIVEYLFNTHGIIIFVFQHRNSLEVLAVSIFLIWLLVEAILILNEVILKWVNKGRGDIHV